MASSAMAAYQPVGPLHGLKGFVQVGGPAYPSLSALSWRTGNSVDGFLKAAKRSDLLVGKSATLESVFDLKAGQGLGLPVPSMLPC
jgi:hypothetical protein